LELVKINSPAGGGAFLFFSSRSPHPQREGLTCLYSLVLGYVDEEGCAAAWAVQLTKKKRSRQLHGRRSRILLPMMPTCAYLIMPCRLFNSFACEIRFFAPKGTPEEIKHALSLYLFPLHATGFFPLEYSACACRWSLFHDSLYMHIWWRLS
jgi:hypothetical protein